MSLRILRAPPLLLAGLLALSGCHCGPTTTPRDAGVDVKDAGAEVDAGPVDAGPPVVDAGQPDAGPPPVLRLLQVLPPRGPSAGGIVVVLQGTGFIRDFSTGGTAAKKVTALKVGGNPVIDFSIIDDETIELRAPPGLSGPASVSLQNPLGRVVCNTCFAYFDELVVTGLAPKQGPLAGANELTLDGVGFTPDVEVLVGGRSSPKVTFVSAKQLKAVVPRGAVADLVDVTVYNKNGVSTQRRAYRYLAPLALSSATPLTGPLAGGTSVIVRGTGFTGATAVTFGAATATPTVDSDSQLTVNSPAATQAGAVAISITTPQGTLTVRNGFTYVEPGGALALFGVFPHVVRPGDVVTLTGQGLDAVGLGVTVGGVPAVVGSQAFGAAQITVPARGAAPRKSDVVVTAGAGSVTSSGGVTWRLGLSTLAPGSGPVAGGTPVTLAGSALPADADVVVGALEASAVVVAAETSLSFVTPRGAGGAPSDVWVREAADPENEAVLAGSFSYDEPLSLGRVQPDRGAIAGGTLVTVLGAGFGIGTVVDFGAARAKDVKLVDSHTLTCRTPKGDVGTLDVRVERGAKTDLLPGGFSYFDPRSISGGLSGGPLVGTINITVLESTPGLYGTPVPLADVMLGTDSTTPFQGITDLRGQLTFSDASLVKAQLVTVTKPDYQSATVTAVNAENLTVFITRTGGGSGNPGSPPPSPPPSVISGRVTGFKSPRPLGGNELLEARVFVAQTSLFGGPPFAGAPNKAGEKWQVRQDGNEYLVFTGAGLRAVYAVLGVLNKGTLGFTPFAMGVKRGVTTSPDNPATGKDLVIDMQLDLTVPVTIDSPLSFPTPAGLEPGTNHLYAWLDLGAEGFIPNPNNWATGKADTSLVSGASTSLSFPNFPQLDGSNFIFLSDTSGAAQYPVSYYFRRQPGDMTPGVTIGPLLPTPLLTAPLGTFAGTIAWTMQPGAVPDIHDVQILRPTQSGNLLVWEVILPGAETQVVLPPSAVQKLKADEAGNQLMVVIYSSRSPKFAYNQWTYDSLSGASWSSFTIALSPGFSP